MSPFDPLHDFHITGKECFDNQSICQLNSFICLNYSFLFWLLGKILRNIRMPKSCELMILFFNKMFICSSMQINGYKLYRIWPHLACLVKKCGPFQSLLGGHTAESNDSTIVDPRFQQKEYLWCPNVHKKIISPFLVRLHPKTKFYIKDIAVENAILWVINHFREWLFPKCFF